MGFAGAGGGKHGWDGPGTEVGGEAVVDRTLESDLSAAEPDALIADALKRRAVSEANGIKVLVNGSEVTLSGRVPTWAERDAAGSAAWASPGVTNVVDNIAIAY